MDFLINALLWLWLARTIKFVLFWIYLWQLKEYHIPRFIDHFRTHKGKKLIFNPLLLVKIILLPLLLLNTLFGWVLLGMYLAETLLFLYGTARRNVKKPKITFKTRILVLAGFLVTGLFFWSMLGIKDVTLLAVSLLLFDILTPIIISSVVLLIQPFFVMARFRILEKARRKMATMNPLFGGLTVIGITGSYGKTSTKEFLRAILSVKFDVLSTPEHKNSEMGIAQTITEDLKPNHKIFIVEMGAYQKGGIKLLCDMVRPVIGVVTGVNEQHLATFGSLDNLLSAEGGRELAANLPEHGLMVVNGDNKYCLDLYKKITVKKKLYTTDHGKVDSDMWAEHIQAHREKLSFIARDKEGGVVHIDVNVAGKQNVQNMLAAITVARHLGLTFDQIIEGVKRIFPHHGGMVVKRGKFGIEIIDSSYSSNPDGVMADLNYLDIFDSKKMIVMPCLIELGEKSKEVHYRIGKKIAKVAGMAVITTRDQFEELKRGAIEAGMAPEKLIFSEKPAEIFTIVTTFCKKGDAVLLEGRVPGHLIDLLL
ncbi:UDP-N-acetylmuramoyl-tripeptide--D-alanyl-D-alanine ligase [Candidatus Parcubacteria bacterium]|nr:UDP-N-acetylmuramoyl-tripeptide--D-alanyl-D-alanine ligase [Candidatus Parcubacteria bacterium]